MLGFQPLAAAPLADNALTQIIGPLSARRFAVSPASENGGVLRLVANGGVFARAGNSGQIVRSA